ncbi:MAG: hypothetical protein KDC35_15820 [Acidobacteria bacterium]|nr:hypothetical protein [Acidobacteriota bacterium]
MLQTVQQWLSGLPPHYALGLGCLGLIAATQIVIWVLDLMEKHKFGSVQLGTIITPMCTGFPNLMIGLFGQAELEGDLIIQLNLGNNIANTSLVTGLLLVVAGPLIIRPAKGKSAKAKRENRIFYAALFFFWMGAATLFMVARDGRVSRQDGLILIAVYALSHVAVLRNRGKVSKKQRLKTHQSLMIVLGLALAAVVIQQSIALVSDAVAQLGNRINMNQLGLLMGLLTVFPESFLMLRLAMRHGNLGISGLVGDCLVSVPLVVGLSSLVRPVTTPVIHTWTDASTVPYYSLAATMLCFSVLATRKKPVSRWAGLLFMGLYAAVWWISS